MVIDTLIYARPVMRATLFTLETELGLKALNLFFERALRLHGKAAQEATALIDTTVQEKNITYPTDAKLAIKIINRVNKIAKYMRFNKEGHLAKKSVIAVCQFVTFVMPKSESKQKN